MSTRTDPLCRPCLSSLVVSARVESISAIILTIVSSMAGVGGMWAYIEGFKKVLDRFEQVNKCIVTGIYPLCRLIRLNVRRIGTYELKKRVVR